MAECFYGKHWGGNLLYLKDSTDCRRRKQQVALGISSRFCLGISVLNCDVELHYRVVSNGKYLGQGDLKQVSLIDWV